MKQILQSIKTDAQKLLMCSNHPDNVLSKLPKPWYLGLKECLLILGRPACSIRHVNNLTSKTVLQK